MKIKRTIQVVPVLLGLISCTNNQMSQSSDNDIVLLNDTIQYHPVRINRADSSILPWYSARKGESYDTCLMLVWDFWNKMETDSNGLKYYMNHQVWKPEHDMRGLGGDQINMALSSWRLLYAYTGYSDILKDMRYMADNYIERSLSGPADKWPFIPYPYNTDIHSGKYDGDMRNGKGITQPDKAGNFGYELVNLYKITGEKRYLESAERIASTLAGHVQPGDSIRSPLPFRINAKTGEAGSLFERTSSGTKIRPALYTTNWTGTMLLFEELILLNAAERRLYEKAFNTFLDWMKTWPLRTNKWGPFFEDVPGWSDTQTNAISFAMFILQHRDLFPAWKEQVKGIFDWTYRELGNHDYEKYKVTVMNEQTVYRVPGNSHSSRQASVELTYADLSGDTSYTTNAIRTLSWATYTVAADGRNRYIRDDIWLTDGYGDYVRHYLRSMAAFPELAPSDENHLLGSTSVITSIKYTGNKIEYKTFDKKSIELLRVTAKPRKVMLGDDILPESKQPAENSWTWSELSSSGALRIFHDSGNELIITL